MSRKCEVSGKGPLTGNRRSHSMHATKHRWNVNLQQVTINGEKKRVSARTLRTLKKQGVI